MNIEFPRKTLDLSSAIAGGDIRVLLMVLVHMTGDEKWLEPPYKPQSANPPDPRSRCRRAEGDPGRDPCRRPEPVREWWNPSLRSPIPATS